MHQAMRHGTRHQVGNVNTDHILFIASGAFHFCKPSDLLAELQGRLPIRVELKPLSEVCGLLCQGLQPCATRPGCNPMCRRSLHTSPHTFHVASRYRMSCTVSSHTLSLSLSLSHTHTQNKKQNDLYRILTEPDHNLVKQQDALMEAEGVQLNITDEVTL